MAKHGKYARRMFTASSLRLAIFRSRIAHAPVQKMRAYSARAHARPRPGRSAGANLKCRQPVTDPMCLVQWPLEIHPHNLRTNSGASQGFGSIDYNVLYVKRPDWE
jgi:hypothetical protein